MATLRGEQVDRPAVSFYELNGLDENPGGMAPEYLEACAWWAGDEAHDAIQNVS
jgi:hypothetical protein